MIVPVRNGAAALPPLLDSLEDQTLNRDRFEVIVVDNGSSDRSAEVAAARGARVVSQPEPNRARARNRGVAAARAGLYAFTDADCVARREWLEGLASCQSLASLVAGKVELTVGPHPNTIERVERIWRFDQAAWVEQGWAATANLLVHAEAFEAVGGFSPVWRHIGEDVDFCVRARAAGYSLAYCGDAVIEHQGERAWGPFLRRMFRHGYSVNQVYYRLGLGYRAWRRPLPGLIGDRALRDLGRAPDDFDPREWRRLARIARAGYAARVVGSLWAELCRAR